MRRLGVCALLALAPNMAWAEESTSRTTNDATNEGTPTDVVVTGSRSTRRGLSVVSVDEKDIERYGQTTVGETLERLPAMQAADDSRGERILTLRGFDQRGVTALVDGVPLAVPYDGQVDLSKLPIDTVERVLVVQGSAPLLYGPNGTGGAIQVVTREPTTGSSLRVRSEAAPFYSTRTSAAASTRFGKDGAFGVLLGGAYENRRYLPLPDGFGQKPNEGGTRRLNSDRSGLTGTGKFTFDLDAQNRFTVHTARFGGEFGVPPATRDFVVRNWRWSDWHATLVGVAHTHTQRNLQIDSHLYASFFGNTLDSYDNDRYRTQQRPKAFQSLYDDKTFGGFVRTTVALHPRAKLNTWTGLRRDSHGGIADRGADEIVARTSLFTTSATTDLEIVRGRVFATAGAQLDGELPDKSPTGPNATASAGLGPLASVTWQNKHFSFGVSGAQRSRAPTLRERFSNTFGARLPNPTLGPERALDLSVDAGFRSKPIKIDISLFDSHVRDLVAEVQVGPSLGQMQNVERARFLGAEGRVQLRAVSWFDVDAGLMLLSARRLGDEPHLAYRPRQKATLAATVRPLRVLSIGLVGRFVGRQDYQNTNTNAWETLGSYALLDARADLRVTDTSTLWIRSTNLTGANVEARYSFPEAGRQIFFGFGTRFEP